MAVAADPASVRAAMQVRNQTETMLFTSSIQLQNIRKPT